MFKTFVSAMFIRIQEWLRELSHFGFARLISSICIAI